MVVTDLRAGTTFEEDGNIYVVLSYEHIKMGRGSANIKVKVRNIKTGATTERSFINGAQVSEIYLEKKEMQFLYKDDALVYFMNPSTFEQVTVPISKLAGNEYLIEGENATVQFYNEEPLSLLLPPKVTMKIADTPPGVRGDSTSNVYKDATLENGMKVRVPLFINTGDDVVVDTRDGSYTKRA
jgi:elongation factor P